MEKSRNNAKRAVESKDPSDESYNNMKNTETF